MKLSIVTINYNNIDGLKKTVESVVSQTNHEFEYIIVDGASTDGGAEYLKEIGDKSYPFELKLISEKDTGIYNAMNKGVRMAKGEYVLMLNSGDYLVASDVLDRVFAARPQADIVCAKCNVSDNGVVVWTSNPPKFVTLSTLYFGGLAHQSTFIRKCLFSRLGLYREDFRYNSDIEFWYRSIILGGASTENVDVVLTDYNLDGISSKEHTNKQYKDEIAAILSNPILQRCIPDYDVWAREKRELAEYKWINKHPLLRKLLRIDYKIRKRLNIL